METIFVCELCNGNVVEGNIKGKSYPIRTDVNFIVLNDFNSAICESCGAIYVTYEESIELEEMYQDSLRVLGEVF